MDSNQNNRSLLLKESLLVFYKNKESLDKFVNVINKNTEYSLRILEWFCSNYSKKHNVVYQLSKTKDFNVYLSYKAQLDSFQKTQFDPFRRNHKGYGKFNLYYDKQNFVETTVGQLNFFKWCIVNKILDYVKKHIGDIKDDMNNSVNYTSSKKSVKVVPDTEITVKNRKKRQPLSVSATRTCVKKYSTVLLNFK